MTYLQMAIKEALRLNPPVALNAREAVRDTVLPRGGGPDGKEPIFVPKGTNVRYQPWCMQRRKDLYGEDAEEFRPERWEKIRPTYVFHSLMPLAYSVWWTRGRRDNGSANVTSNEATNMFPSTQVRAYVSDASCFLEQGLIGRFLFGRETCRLVLLLD